MPVIWLLIACRAADPIETDGDTDPADTDIADTDPGEVGVACPIADQVGRIDILTDGGNPQINGRIYDKPDPWIGAPALADDICAFHAFGADTCGTCDGGEVCSVEGECVPERRTLKDVTVTVTSGSESRTFEADPTTGDLYGELDIGDPGATYTVEVSWGDHASSFGPLSIPAGVVATVTSEADSMQPGDLDVSWTPVAEGYVTTRIPINHHASGPTFTTCMAPAEAGGFVVDAAMVDPLSVITGLEFQGLEHAQAASVATADGCIDVRLGTRMYTFVTYP